jgi:hypothetical protein
MSLSEIRSLLITCLAEKTGKSISALTSELQAAGPEFPYDSMWLVSAGASAARQMGLKLKHARQHANAFKSVETLATYLHELDRQRDAA